MKTEEILLHSRYDDSLLGASVMIPDIPAKAVFVLVHGMAEHRKRYVEFMTYLCMQGYALVMHDHRGHGDSVKNEKDLGYFYENGGSGNDQRCAANDRLCQNTFSGYTACFVWTQHGVFGCQKCSEAL